MLNKSCCRNNELRAGKGRYIDRLLEGAMKWGGSDAGGWFSYSPSAIAWGNYFLPALAFACSSLHMEQ